MPFDSKAHAYDAVEGQGHQTDERMGADAIRQEMLNRGDLDVAFEDSKAPLDIGEPLVVRFFRKGTFSPLVGYQRKRAVKEPRFCHGFFVH